MDQRSDVEIAERRTNRRARVLVVSALLFICMQATYFGRFGDNRLVDQVKVSAWLVWSIVLLFVLATGGGFAQTKAVRALMNDETTLAHRADAFRWGFWAAMIGAIGLYGVTMIDPETTAREAVHLILTFGIGVAILRFGMLERRASRDG